jgi:hypothetical protein
MSLPHDDLPMYREAVNATQLATGFAPRLIEKDYFCTLVLEWLCGAAPSLVFKGGTCLAKVHAGFYRLSVAERREVALQPVEQVKGGEILGRYRLGVSDGMEQLPPRQQRAEDGNAKTTSNLANDV